MIIFNFVLRILVGIRLIFRNKLRQKGAVLLTYLKLKVKYLLFVKMLRMQITREDVLGFDMELLDYGAFIIMFEEIFVGNSYYFKSKKKNPLIIDCGANIGIATIFFKLLYPDSTIIAFEPDSNALPLLKRNISKNNLSRVQLVEKALSDSVGRLKFYSLAVDPGSTMASMVNEKRSKVYRIVNSALLSGYINRQVDFLKMDIEGSEKQVLTELNRKNKLRFVRSCCIEYHHHIKPGVEDLLEILNILRKNKFGYQFTLPGYQFTLPIELSTENDIFQDAIICAYRK